MRLVNDDAEVSVLMLLPDLGNNVREFLNGRNDNTPAVLDRLAEIAGMLCPDDRILHLHELLDGVANLLVKDLAVSDNKHSINDRLAVLLQTDELVRQPCNRIGLAGASAVLYQIALACAVFTHIGKKFLYHIELVVSRKYLLDLLLFGLLVLFDDYLCIILDYAGELCFGEDILPEVVCHDTVRVWRVACSVVVPLVERQEPAIFLCQLRAEFNSTVIHSEMYHAAFEREHGRPCTAEQHLRYIDQ